MYYRFHISVLYSVFLFVAEMLFSLGLPVLSTLYLSLLLGDLWLQFIAVPFRFLQ